MDTTHDELQLHLVISEKEEIAKDIWRFEFRDPTSTDLPLFEAGSNLAIHVPSGARRCYSLCNDPAERDRYVVAVKRDAAGRGGSICLVDETQEGDTITVSSPKNDFPLDERANEFIFIAGGIGITPILSMMRHLRSDGTRRFRLFYVARDPAAMAFLEELQGDDWRPFVTVHHDHGDMSNLFDFWPIFERPTKAHVYCCGPRPLMDSVKDMTGHWPPGSVHFESFGVNESVLRQNKPFKITVKHSGMSYEVPTDKSILAVLRDAGIKVPSSCENGTCGSCRTALCAGTADHRDLVLRDDEKSSQIIVCVSRAMSEELILDL